MAKIVIDTKLNTKQFDKQMEKVQKDLVELKYEYDAIKTSKPFDGQNEMLIDYQNKIERATNSLIRLKEQQNKLALSNVKNVGYNLTPSLASGFSLSRQTLTGRAMGDLTEKTEYVADSVKDLKNAFDIAGESGEKVGVRTGQGFDRGIASLKRFALSLFGIRSAFSLVRRATSTYLSQHEDTANKINAIWVALGNALAPIIEAIADMVLKFIGYLNVFLQALGFDVDLTKGMNKSTKAINGTTKAMKELNNQVAPFDEMNVAQKETSSGGVGGGGIGGTNGFEMPELDEGIVKKIKDIAGVLKENKDLLLAIGTIIAGYKVAKWLGGLGSLIGGGTGANAKGLLGLSSILKGLLAMEVIAITISVIYYGKQLNDLKKLNKGLEKMYENNTKGIDEVNKKNLESVKSYEKGSKAIDDYVYEMQQEVEQAKTQIETKKRQNEEMSTADKVWDAFGKTGEKNNKIIMENTQRLINNAQNLQALAKEGKLTDEQMEVYNQTMQYLNQTQDELGGFLNDNKTNMMNFGTSVYETEIDLYNQIDALKKAETTTTNTTNSQKNAYGSLREKVQTEMNKINNLYAKPTVDVQVKTNKLSSALEAINSSSFLAGLGINTGLSTTISKLRNIGMARGGIFYNPGRGVSLSNVVVGEATGGAEGVIPMNNEQSMDLIGQSIAKHLVVNLTNTTMLDSKVIAREQRRIEDENNFATNGRGVL